jgi:hypothetical protein
MTWNIETGDARRDPSGCEFPSLKPGALDEGSKSQKQKPGPLSKDMSNPYFPLSIYFPSYKVFKNFRNIFIC